MSIDAYVQVATDYVYRGISYAGGQTSPSAALSVRHERGAYASFWAGRDDIAGILGEPRRRDIETEYALGYQFKINRDWSLGLEHTWHEFLRQNQPRDHDYRESQIQLHYKDNMSFSTAFAENIWTTGLDAKHLSMSYRYAAELPYTGELLMEQEFGATRFSRGSAARRSTNLIYLKSAVIKTFNENWFAQIDANYSKANRDGLFESDRIGTHIVFSVGYLIF